MNEENSSQNGKKVLIIEDEQFISELYVRALTKNGYEVSVIFDGQEALKAAMSDEYDVILLDLMLPNITGQDILSHLRSAENKPNLKAKIIITTNLEMADKERLVMEAQADGYLVKAELTPKELVTYLNQLQLNN